MDVRPDNSKILMSEALRGRLPDEYEDESMQPTVAEGVTAIVRITAGVKEKMTLVGAFRSALFEKEPEIEFRVHLDEALDLVSAKDPEVDGFEIHKGERVVKVDGPFLLKGTRIDEVAPGSDMCLLALGLKRVMVTVV